MDNKEQIFTDDIPDVVATYKDNKIARPQLPHLHNRCEIYYNISGAKGYIVDKKVYPCQGHDLFIVPKAKVHKAIVTAEAEYHRCVISIDSRVIDYINLMPGTSRNLAWLDCVGDTVTPKINLDSETHEAILAFIDKYNSEDGELSRFAGLLELLDTLGSQFKISPMAEAIIPESLAIRSLIAIEDNFQNAKISDIAEKLYVNSGHLGKIFKAEFGLTISDYLIMRKIAEAKRLLYTGLSVKEACHLSGFGNYSNFIRTFKKIEGYPPGKFEINSEPIS